MCVFVSFLPISIYLILVIQVVLGATIYIGNSAILKLDAFEYLWNTVKEIVEKRKGDNYEEIVTFRWIKIFVASY